MWGIKVYGTVAGYFGGSRSWPDALAKNRVDLHGARRVDPTTVARGRFSDGRFREPTKQNKTRLILREVGSITRREVGPHFVLFCFVFVFDGF